MFYFQIPAGATVQTAGGQQAFAPTQSFIVQNAFGQQVISVGEAYCVEKGLKNIIIRLE